MTKITQHLKFICIALLATMQVAHAQTKIGGTAGAGDASAVLELQSTTNNQGFLPPRLTTAQRNAITTPAVGLTIYNTDDQCLNVYKGSTNGWFNMCSGGGGFSFTNCASPTITGSINLGGAANATVTLNYVNNTGQSSAIFGSGITNGITLTTTGGSVVSLAAGAGTITLTASGTPTASGSITIPLVIAGVACNVPITIGGCQDPSTTLGSTGCVAFTYRGSPVVYSTVRAKDNKIWLQQNLGASRMATASNDAQSYGDFFQYGRWDDGGQARNSTVINTTTLSANNPSGLGTGVNGFLNNSSGSGAWWIAGTATDTWSGTTASATNGIDPCTALGTGWRLPTGTEWNTMFTSEGISTNANALTSNLKIPAAGYRDWQTGNVGGEGSIIDLASSTPYGGGAYQYVDNSCCGLSAHGNNTRGQGTAVRCLK